MRKQEKRSEIKNGQKQYSARFLPYLFDCCKRNSTDEKDYCAHRGDSAENRFIAAALLFSEKLLCSAADGTGKAGAVACPESFRRYLLLKM